MGVSRMTDELNLSDIHEYAHKLFKSFNNLNFKSNYNDALQAFYLEEKLYVVRSQILNDYQYTLVEADSEEQAIRKCFWNVSLQNDSYWARSKNGGVEMTELENKAR